jgi:hypothetical protein
MTEKEKSFSIETEIPVPVPVPVPVPTAVPTTVPTAVPTLVPTPVPTQVPIPVPTPAPSIFLQKNKLNKKWAEVQILGPFNTGTNLLHQIISRAYDTKIGPIGSTIIWKHTIIDNIVVRNKIKNVLKIVMVRDPYFWLRSLEKKRYTLESKSRNPNDINQLLVKPCKLRTHKFSNCVQLWNYYYKNYLNLLSKDRTLYISYEQLIFEPEKVINVLSEYIQLKPTYEMKDIITIMRQPSNKRAKNHKDAVAYNKNSNNRKNVYDPSIQTFIQKNLDKELMKIFGYQI